MCQHAGGPLQCQHYPALAGLAEYIIPHIPAIMHTAWLRVVVVMQCVLCPVCLDGLMRIIYSYSPVARASEVTLNDMGKFN